ncbi:hypothetical protein M3223_08835 [Paenibacillus pasadenensis]|uniref:hypothetical protein n=1 Tax=Paenibacillus pasadenensis TaxID=217090 RepID=UPI0020423ED3|nr:hypothetical protein [Paenibacillus pasadenensis]MCM3747459.1 hypothetical protein [Paenibacillus pasadenensis]
MTRFLKWAWVPVIILLVVAACSVKPEKGTEQPAASALPIPTTSPSPSSSPEPEEAPVLVDREGPSMVKFVKALAGVEDLSLEYEVISEIMLKSWPNALYAADGESVKKAPHTYFNVVEFKTNEDAKKVYDDYIKVEKETSLGAATFINGPVVLMMIDEDEKVIESFSKLFLSMTP